MGASRRGEKKLKIMSDVQERFGFKWEFVRRNKEYRKDYNKFIKVKTKKSKNKWIKIIQGKYELGEPMDPEISFFKTLEGKGGLDAGIDAYKIPQNAMWGKLLMNDNYNTR